MTPIMQMHTDLHTSGGTIHCIIKRQSDVIFEVDLYQPGYDSRTGTEYTKFRQAFHVILMVDRFVVTNNKRRQSYFWLELEELISNTILLNT